MYVFFNQVEAGLIGIETETVQAVIPSLDGSGIPRSLVVSIAGDSVAVEGEPSSVVGQLGTGSGEYVNLPLLETISGPLPPWGMDAWIRRSNTIQAIEAFSAPVPATALRLLGRWPVDIIVQGDPAAVASAIQSPIPDGGPPIVEALILADGNVPYRRNIGGTSHVSGSGDYEITLGGAAENGFVIPSLTPFGAPVASPIFLSWSSTGPGSLIVFVRDGSGAPVDAPFGLFGIASVVS